jgi:hypothetical protein
MIRVLQAIFTVALLDHDERIVKQLRNPLNKCGRKVFSQSDEDGITCEIIKRIGIERGVFAEFGIGNGLENNTIVLASLGWKGFWVGAERLAYNPPPAPLSGQQRDFVFFRELLIQRTSCHLPDVASNPYQRTRLMLCRWTWMGTTYISLKNY